MGPKATRQKKFKSNKRTYRTLCSSTQFSISFVLHPFNMTEDAQFVVSSGQICRLAAASYGFNMAVGRFVDGQFG